MTQQMLNGAVLAKSEAARSGAVASGVDVDVTTYKVRFHKQIDELFDCLRDGLEEALAGRDQLQENVDWTRGSSVSDDACDHCTTQGNGKMEEDAHGLFAPADCIAQGNGKLQEDGQCLFATAEKPLRLNEVSLDEAPDSPTSSTDPEASESKKRRSWSQNMAAVKSRMSESRTSHVNSRRVDGENIFAAGEFTENELEAIEIAHLTRESPSLHRYLSGDLALEQGTCRAKVRDLVMSNAFEVLFLVFIFANAMFIGVQVDWNTAHPGSKEPWALKIVDYMFTFVFLVELTLRVIAFGPYLFFTGKFVGWNLFDTLLVSFSLVDVIIDIFQISAEGGTMDLLRVLRIVKMTKVGRVFRIVRIIRFIHKLRILLHSILCTLQSVFWTFTILAMIIYVFGVLLTNATGNYFESADGPRDEGLTESFSTVSRSMFTLFQAISGGVNWHVHVKPLSKTGEVYVFCFVFYVAFTVFAVLNVVTSTFCQSAIESASQSVDIAMHDEFKNQQEYINRVKMLFKDMDEDSSGILSREEFERGIRDARLQYYFSILDLQLADALNLFNLLDFDGSGEIDLDEFVTGCVRFRGTAKSLDLAKVLNDNKQMVQLHKEQAGKADSQLQEVMQSVKQLSDRMNGMQNGIHVQTTPSQSRVNSRASSTRSGHASSRLNSRTDDAKPLGVSCHEVHESGLNEGPGDEFNLDPQALTQADELPEDEGMLLDNRRQVAV